MTTWEKGKKLVAHSICEILRVAKTIGTDITIPQAMQLHVDTLTSGVYDDIPKMYAYRSMFIEHMERGMLENGMPPAHLHAELKEHRADIAEEEALIRYMDGGGKTNGIPEPTVRENKRVDSAREDSAREDSAREDSARASSRGTDEEAANEVARKLQAALGDTARVLVVDASPTGIDALIKAFDESLDGKRPVRETGQSRLLLELAKSAEHGEQIGPTAHRLTGVNYRVIFRQLTAEGVFECDIQTKAATNG